MCFFYTGLKLPGAGTAVKKMKKKDRGIVKFMMIMQHFFGTSGVDQ